MPTKFHTLRSSLPWKLSLGTTVVAVLAHVLPLLVLRDRLPDPLATHWNAAGVADGTGGFPSHLLIGVLTLMVIGLLMPLSTMVKPSPGKTSGEPLLAGLGNGLLVAIAGLLLSGTVGQLDAVQALGTTMNVPVLVTGLVLAVIWGALSAHLVRKASPAPSGAPAAGTARAVAVASAPVIAPGTRISSSIRGPWWLSLLLLISSAGILVMGCYAVQDSPVALFGLVPAALLLLLVTILLIWGTVVADDDGIRVLCGGPLKFLHVRPGQLSHAEAGEIRPLEYGGWGLRISGAGIALITRAGPGVVVQRTSGADRIYSVATTEDAIAMAAVLNRVASGNEATRS